MVMILVFSFLNSMCDISVRYIIGCFPQPSEWTLLIYTVIHSVFMCATFSEVEMLDLGYVTFASKFPLEYIR